MNTLAGNVHLLAGGSERVDDVMQLLASEGIRAEGNPDLYVREYGSFGIDDAHELRSRAAARAFGERRVFVVTADSMTSEAQNALLKTLEEPSGDALFFFIIPSPETLLPTLRSRAQVLALGHTMRGKDTAAAFLRASAARRLELLKPLLEKGDDDKRDFGAILSFLASLERSFSEAPENAAAKEGLEAVYRARRYIGDRGALVKPLLEQVALLVPQL